MNGIRPKFPVFLLFACLVFATAGRAQTASSGALTGVVSDSSGAVVPGAKVTATNEATGEVRNVVTQQNGSYLLPLLLPGSYKVEFSNAGFKTSVKTGLQINVTETARFDVRLELGTLQEQVMVSTDASLVQTESASLGRVTDNTMVTNLPLVTRNYTQIVTLSPGISAGVTNATELGRGSGGTGGGNFRANGASGADNNFQMNGVQVNDLQSSGSMSGGVAIPNPDSIQEFKVQTGQYDASYGRNAGANVNVVTRSGNNEFHGTAFEFFRNTVLNANEFFRNRTGQKRGVLNQNQFGFTLGGPIKKDKLLFFITYQGIRQVNGVGGGATSSFYSPPFTADRSKAAMGKMFAGLTGQLGGVAVAPDGSNISQQALNLLNFKGPDGQYIIPTPQTVTPSQPLALQGFSSFSVPASFHEDQFMVNLDFLHTSKSKFVARFFYAGSSQFLPFPASQLATSAPGFPQLTDNRMRNLTASHTYSFSSRVLNQMDFGYHRTGAPTIQQELFKWSDIGSKAPSTANDYPAIGISGSLALGGNGQGVDIVQNHYTIQDTFTYLRGRHTIRAGGGITISRLAMSGFHFYGGTQFLSWPDFMLGLPGGPTSSGGNGSQFSNIYLSLDIPGMLDRAWALTDGNAYFQDDIKLTPAFTLNLGLRFERLSNLGDTLGRNSGFDVLLANPNPPAAGVVNGYVVSNNYTGTLPAGVTQLDNNYGIRGIHENNLAPRVGFAWKLPILRNSVLRGGYGMYQSRTAGQPFLQLAAAPPFALVRQVAGAPNATASFANPFGPELTFPQFPAYSPTTQRTLTFVGQDYRPPVTQQFSLNLQTELSRDYLLEVGYVGTRGTHQILNWSPNQALLASPSNPIRGETTNTFANISKRVPYLGFTAPGLNTIDSAASSWYHGLQASLTKRLSNGLQFLFAYTFAHAYSTTGANTDAGGTAGVVGNQNNMQDNYGRTNFNREHRVVVSYVYQLPSPKRYNSAVNMLLGGWSVAGVTTLQSGQPLRFTGTNANNVFGITSDRAELAPNCTYADLPTPGSTQERLANYFNKACVLRNATGAAIWPIVGADGRGTAFGTSGVAIITGPGQSNTDLSIIKRTSLNSLREGSNLEFRTEFFNVFNTPQFSNPSTNVSSATFGVISSTNVNPRIMQFALKLNF